MANTDEKIGPACLRDLLALQADGEKVSDDLLFVYRREQELIRFAISNPAAVAESGISASDPRRFFEGADYAIAWKAIGIASGWAGPVAPQSVLHEMARLAPKRFAGPAGGSWMNVLEAQAPVDTGYALEVLLPEVVARHQTKVWGTRMVHLAERSQTERDVTQVQEEFVTQAHRITMSSDGGAIGENLHEHPWDPRRVSTGHIIPTGIAPLDRAIGGLGRGEMMVVGGGTNAGKSYLAICLERNQTLMNRPVLHLSVEDPKDLMYCRNVAAYTNPAQTPLAIRQGQADPMVVDAAIAEMIREQSNYYKYVQATKWSCAKICAAIRRHRYVCNVHMVVVDYLQAIHPDAPSNNRTQEVSYNIAALKKTAEDCGVALVIMSQLTREGYKDGTEPNVNSLKYAGDIENEAEVVVLLWRDADEVLHAKFPKLKWSRKGGHRYLVETHPVTGAFGTWADDYSIENGGEDNGKKTYKKKYTKAQP